MKNSLLSMVMITLLLFLPTTVFSYDTSKSTELNDTIKRSIVTSGDFYGQSLLLIPGSLQKDLQLHSLTTIRDEIDLNRSQRSDTRFNAQDLQVALKSVFETLQGQKILAKLKEMNQTRLFFETHIVLNKDGLAQSWTEYQEDRLTIHLYLNNPKLRQKELITLITHELGQIIHSQDYQTVIEILNRRFNKIPYSPIQFESYSEDIGFKTLISTFRSFSLENKVHSEIGYKHNYHFFEKENCVSTLRRTAHSLLELPQFSSSQELILQFLNLFNKNILSDEICQEIIEIDQNLSSHLRPHGGPRPSTMGDP